MASNEFEKLIASLPKEEQAKLQKSQALVSDEKDIKPANMAADKEAAYKSTTGRPELDKNVGGYGNGGFGDNTTTAKPITEKVGQEAKEAAAPIKDDMKAAPTEPPPATTTPPQQRHNAFTQLGEAKPKDQQPPEPPRDKDKDR